MPILDAEVIYYLSGGASNAVPDDSLGGVISSVQIINATLDNLFDTVTSAETTSGDTEYRCEYVRNTNGTLTLQNAVIWIQTQTPSTDTSVEIALGSSAVGGVEQTIADETTAPVGVSFSAPANEGTALSIGDIPANSWKAVWVKRIVSPGASAFTNDGCVLRTKGDTAA